MTVSLTKTMPDFDPRQTPRCDDLTDSDFIAHNGLRRPSVELRGRRVMHYFDFARADIPALFADRTNRRPLTRNLW